jgi:hypothetical protein
MCPLCLLCCAVIKERIVEALDQLYITGWAGNAFTSAQAARNLVNLATGATLGGSGWVGGWVGGMLARAGQLGGWFPAVPLAQGAILTSVGHCRLLLPTADYSPRYTSLLPLQASWGPWRRL